MPQDKKGKTIIIANPIYDVVFKNLMTTGDQTNKDIASFFVGTILDEEITDIEFRPQEYTYHKKIKPKKKSKTEKEGELSSTNELPSQTETLSVIRMDFVVTILTQSGKRKKVLIEIQKYQKPTDIPRFSTYLGELYQQKEKSLEKGKKGTMPIVVIFMLGFILPDIEVLALKVDRKFVDIISGTEVKKSENRYIEGLTHDAYFIQIPRLKNEVYKNWDECSKLEKMLSMFEQDNFVDNNFTKKYLYPLTDPNIKKMIESLELLQYDANVRRAMQEEYWAEVDEAMWESQVEELTLQNKNLYNQNATLSSEVVNLSSENMTLSSENMTLSSENMTLTSEVVNLSSENMTLSSENMTLSRQIYELQQRLKQAGLELPSA
ncbi:MAG: hypothetical protein FWH18_06810 [Marinilabiliaceae bacterium]|nr:hypothetical protein [Marinilabiliaceae bacterium]